MESHKTRPIEHMIHKMAEGWTCIALGCKERPNSEADHFCATHWKVIPFDVRKRMLEEKRVCLLRRKWTKPYLRLAHEAVFHCFTYDQARKAKVIHES